MMKRLKPALIFGALFSVALILSSFTHQGNQSGNNGQGNVVTIDNGQTWVWFADNCNAPLVPSTSARLQTTSKGFVNVTVTFQLPEGHCDIPAKGAKVVHYSPDSWAVINSNGKVNAKIVYNPNGN